MIFSATLPNSELVYRQAVYALLGLVLMLVITSIDYHILGNLALAGYLLAIVLLTVVLASGHIFYGSQRWLNIGLFPLQPSEPAKILLIIALAKFFADHEEEILRFRYVLLSLVLVVIPVSLTLAQPDLGTSIIFLAIWVGMAMMAGVRLKHWVILGLSVLLTAPLGWLMMHDYMRTRLLVFVNPYSDPLGAGYSIIQALTAVGSGGFLGRGFTSGTQSQLHFLRVQYSDFIFSVLAEELGFIGALVLFGLFLALLWRGVRAAALSRENFGRLIATGIVAMLLFQILVNVGMNMGLMPVTGVPLPFISYGGSSLITVMTGIGLLESIVMRHKKIEF